jgi:hypothetical protein
MTSPPSSHSNVRPRDAAGAQAGEKSFVDWAGSSIRIYDRTTSVVWQASLFVAVLAGFHKWTEGTHQQMEAWCVPTWKPSIIGAEFRWPSRQHQDGRGQCATP